MPILASRTSRRSWRIPIRGIEGNENVGQVRPLQSRAASARGPFELRESSASPTIRGLKPRGCYGTPLEHWVEFFLSTTTDRSSHRRRYSLSSVPVQPARTGKHIALPRMWSAGRTFHQGRFDPLFRSEVDRSIGDGGQLGIMGRHTLLRLGRVQFVESASRDVPTRDPADPSAGG